MGPCEIHSEHAHTIGPDGALYACPGFTGDRSSSTGHIDGRQDELAQNGRDAIRNARRVERVRRLRVHPGLRRRLLGRGAHRAWRHEPAELPQAQLRGRRGFARARRRGARDRNYQLAVQPPSTNKEKAMKNDRKETDKKKGTLRPWLVDVAVEHLR